MAVVLNLADWIERRRLDVGPYADHIIHSVRAHEAEIAELRIALSEIKGMCVGPVSRDVNLAGIRQACGLLAVNALDDKERGGA